MFNKSKKSKTIWVEDRFGESHPQKIKERKKYDPQAIKSPPKRPAKEYVGFLMGRREYSRKELEQKMKLKGYEPLMIEQTLDWMTEHNYQSDERFAASVVRQQGRRLGNSRLSQNLQQKGVDKELILESLEQADDEGERANGVIDKFSKYDLTDLKIKQKAFRFLMSRGFSYDLTQKAWKELCLKKEEEES